MKVTDTIRRHISIEMDNDEQQAVRTANKLISHILSVVGLETGMIAEEDGITVNTNQLALARAVLKAIAENSEWDEI